MSAARMAVLASLAAGGLLCGCAGESESVPAVGPGGAMILDEPMAQARPPIADLPVPLDFKLDEGRSRNAASSAGRWVDHVYKGSDDKYAVARFYKRHMPANGWTLLMESFVQSNFTQEYDKKGERAKVTISDLGGLLGSRTQVKIVILPAGTPAEARN